MGEKLKIVRGSGNVFLDIGFSPDEAQNLRLRSELMSKIEHFVRSSGLTQKECAVRMGVTQPRLSDHLKGIRSTDINCKAPLQKIAFAAQSAYLRTTVLIASALDARRIVPGDGEA